MVVRAVVLDIGGVLEFTPDTGWRAKWGKILNREVDDIDAELRSVGRHGSIGNCSFDEWLAALQQITGMSQEQLDAFMADFWEEYLGTLNIELYNYVRDHIHPRYQTAILSNSFLGAGREKEIPLYHFDEITDFIIYSHEVGMRKPDYRIYQLTCDRLELPPGQVVFIDDVEENVTAAREVSLHAIQFKDTRQTIHELEACLASERD